MAATLLIILTGVQVFIYADDPTPFKLAMLVITALCTVGTFASLIRR